MTVLRHSLRLSPAVGFAAALLCLSSTVAQTDRLIEPIYLAPGSDVARVVNNSPSGSTFVFKAGVFRMQSIIPKDGDSFSGQGQVILSGSAVLTFRPDPSSRQRWMADAKSIGTFHGNCQKDYPLCGYTQDLFVDGNLQQPVVDIHDLRLGKWYFDRTSNIVYLSTPPAGHQITLSSIADAFHGSATNVRISNLIVEQYATPAQRGAIGGNRTGEKWTISDVEVRWNHGAGCDVGPGSQIIHSRIHHNGQLGISASGADVSVLENEIAWNNFAGFSTTWEAGGAKFWATTDLLVKSNDVHDNNGNGLWTDTDNVGALYENNIVKHNKGSGIAHEVSGRAIIRNNTVEDNGTDLPANWLWNGQIQVQNSSDVEVYGNNVIVPAIGGNGIVIINQARGSGAIGPWIAAHNSIHNNVITYRSARGISGYADDTHQNANDDNHFDYNHHIALAGGQHWAWEGIRTWSDLKRMRQEEHGQCCN